MTGGTTRRLTAVVLAGAMLLAACGGDDDGEVAAPPGTTDDGASTVGTDGTGGDEETAEGTLARYADYESIEYDDPTRWVCRPDTEDICDDGLDATVIEADGTTAVEAFTPAGDPPIDCFYVYPTISRDETTYSDWDASPEEEGYVTLQQAARLGEVCRVFAPVYRQRTLTALTAALAGGEGAGTTTPPEEGDPVADVLDAFRTYMARDNGGRGVVLIGHSQGASVLNDVIATEIDPNEDVRDLLVAAYLVGSSVAVPEGQVVGGDFAEVPLCTAGDQTGCVLTWATFRDTAPPPEGSLFGRPRDGEGVAGCVNPAAVEGGSSELAPYFPADASASILASLGAGGGGAEWLPGTEITTPFVTLPGLVRGECVERDGFTYLEVTVQPDPGPRADDIAGDLTPEWGLHLVDVSIAMGDVVDRVRVQADAFTAGR